MALLNYSTTVPVEKSIMEIQKVLVENGARKILYDYDGQGNIVSLSFSVITPYGELHIRLPAKKEPVLKVLLKQKAQKKIKIKVDEQQALRVAWRTIKDWVESQMALIQHEQARMEECFLPYILDNKGQTMFEKFEKQQLLLKSGEGIDCESC